MSGLWLIAYDLIPEKEADYLDWFHGIHIPEKLARPGYTWPCLARPLQVNPMANPGLPAQACIGQPGSHAWPCHLCRVL